MDSQYRLQNDPAFFRACLRVDRDGTAVEYGRIETAWQRADNEALDPAWLFIAGRSNVEPSIRRLFAERPRGASKTTDEAVAVLWVLFASARPVSGVAVAADLDQARLLLSTVSRIVALNPWLAEVIEIQRDRIRNPHNGAELVVISSDAGSSYGLTPDFIICDEISHWQEGRGQAMWDSLASSAAKKKHCIFVCITNAGWMGTWQWPLREAIRLDPTWRFSRLESPPEWIDEDRLAEQRRLLPEESFRRLWLNLWVSGSGSGLSVAALSECCIRKGPYAIRPIGLDLIGSVDLGLRRDHAAFVIMFVDPNRGKLVLAQERSWDPKNFGGEIPLHLVKDAVLDARSKLQLHNVVLDFWQGAQLAQDLRDLGFHVIIRETSSRQLSREATSLLDCVNNRAIELFPGMTYSDLEKVRIVERPTGSKLEWPRDNAGHCDRGAALCQMLPEAITFLNSIMNQDYDSSGDNQYGDLLGCEMAPSYSGRF